MLVGDLVQKDTLKNKNEYHLRATTIDDEVTLQWVCTQDMMLIDQKRRDIRLVEMVDKVSIAAAPIERKNRAVEQSKETESNDGADGNNSNYLEAGDDGEVGEQ